MPDSAPVQELQGLEQVLAEPVQLVDAERAVPADLLGEGVALDVLDPDDGSPLVRRPCLEGRVEKAGDVGVVELAELLRLPLEAARGGLVERDLEDASRFALLDQVAREVEPLPRTRSTVQPLIASPRPAVSGSMSGSASGAVSSSSIVSSWRRNWRTDSVRSAAESCVAPLTRSSMAGLTESATEDGTSACSVVSLLASSPRLDAGGWPVRIR